jgi:uncharacterized protein YkwD
MVKHHYFAHDSRSGASFRTRVSSSGWTAGRRRWTIGENIAWGSGERAEPRSIVAAWLDSAPHRRVLLNAGFRVVGIGIACGTPVASARDSATYTTDFGS